MDEQHRLQGRQKDDGPDEVHNPPDRLVQHTWVDHTEDSRLDASQEEQMLDVDEQDVLTNVKKLSL